MRYPGISLVWKDTEKRDASNESRLSRETPANTLDHSIDEIGYSHLEFCPALQKLARPPNIEKTD